jgi:hypothetical protein
MEDRYWLRHPSLNGHLGPYRAEDIREAIESETFPRDSYLLVDSGQNETDRMASPYWSPATVILKMEAPPPTSTVVQKPEPPLGIEREQIRQRLRQGTAYSILRTLIVIMAIVAMVAVVAEVILGMAVISFVGGNDGHFEKIIAVGWKLLEIIVCAAFLQAMLDIADANLKRQD